VQLAPSAPTPVEATHAATMSLPPGAARMFRHACPGAPQSAVLLQASSQRRNAGSHRPLRHEVLVAQRVPPAPAPLEVPQDAVLCVSKPVLGKGPKRHVEPAAHSLLLWADEQHVSAQPLVAQRPERHSVWAPHAAPPIFDPSCVERPSHSGRTQ
jgi:hypothetical protein